MNLFSLALELQRYAPRTARALAAHAVPWMIPFTSGLGLRVEENSCEATALSLPLRRRTKNHLGSAYFGAQLTLAEICMGLLLFNRYPPGPYGVLVKRVEVDFHRKAKSALLARCAPGEEAFSSLARGLESEGKADAWLEVPLMNTDGQAVTSAGFLATIRDFR